MSHRKGGWGVTDSGSSSKPASQPNSSVWLVGGSEMGELVRTKEWSKTPLGRLISWPQSLRSAISICLGSRFPIVIYWGAQLVVLYNDAYADTRQ